MDFTAGLKGGEHSDFREGDKWSRREIVAYIITCSVLQYGFELLLKDAL